MTEIRVLLSSGWIVYNRYPDTTSATQAMRFLERKHPYHIFDIWE